MLTVERKKGEKGEKRRKKEKKGEKGRKKGEEETFVGSEKLHHFVIGGNLDRVLEVSHNVVPLKKERKERKS